ncbi:MAG TPA: M1 family aminopeptidase [Bacteroidota bacterium]|nr:M1 family aminopeptidase [Bacteroidota bacterium]
MGIFHQTSIGQFSSLQHPEQESKTNFAFEESSFQQRLLSSAASNWFDVSYYGLNLDIATSPSYLKGDVTIAGVCRQGNTQTLTLDLMNTMRIDSVHVNGQPCSFAQSVSSFDITLDHTYQSGDLISAEIFYEGVPVPTGFGSFEFDSHSGVPWVYSLSEPYGAQDWWPCKNTQSDKADSADIVITCDSSFKAASQGILLSTVNQNNGKTTYHWKTHYPIASYLISVALTNYTQFSEWFRYSATDSMEVRNYVLPEDYAAAAAVLPHAVGALGIYSNLFGTYPFIKEKYGQAQFARGGMEHQTMTSIGTFDEKIVVHELAHQWFGDKITAKTWSDLWLHEGFAVYCTALYLEKTYGVQSYTDYINLQISSAMSAEGEVGNPDTSSAQSLFNYDLIYGKGACVLHMLRHVLGDSVFFASIRAYANQPSLQYSNATTQDLEAACEKVSGKNLSYFFQEWIYGERYPIYQYSWDWNSSNDSSFLTITLAQAPVRTNPAIFTMPVDIRISSPGKDTVVSLFNNVQNQTFTLPFPVRPSSVVLDPDGWIVKLAYPASDFAPASYLLEQNYPNPFNAGTTIKYQLAHAGYVTLKIYDVLGREIATLVSEQQIPGTYQYPWTGQNFASGVYFYRLTAGDVRLQKKMILLK